MSAPQDVLQLVARFQEQYDSYRSPTYNETQLRREFVDPFFKALGWDIDNEQGYAEAYKDVIHEDSVKIGSSTKAPDYSFRIGGVRKFFVETKKPAVNLQQDPSPAYQVRRYAWSSKLPLSILTDFEELAIYDCRVRPQKDDRPSTARTLYLTYDQYDERWQDIASVFSREAILKGSFDRYVESKKKKRGTAEVDDAILSEIEHWRAVLARNLALRNPKLSQRELNFAVQKTIDRIIFLRICEDRGTELYGRLQSLLNGPNIYPRMCQFFREADDRYNSGLFHFTDEKNRTEIPDEWTLSLNVDDRVLKEIVQGLYYPESPYEFSVLGADILGQVYEQFLGKVIRLTKGHRAVVEDKPEIKKAGGVYYTPSYVVDYIVQNTVGNLLEGKSPHEVAARTERTWKPSKRGRPLCVVDPACGSGSFLIGAYQHLLDWYRDWYVEHDPAKHKDRIYQTRQNQWRLTTTERKRVLLDHIYGVDIDPQAVEVTKLSLLLKVLEGENQESLQRQLRLFRERALPDLADNIKCGNSLIGPDFYQGKQIDLFDEEERLRINVFDWNAEFSEIMQSDGFDAVIGNPPYVRMEAFKPLKEYLRKQYEAHAERTDLYVYFLEKSIHLLQDGGFLSFIVSSSFLRAGYGEPLRRVLKQHASILRIVDFGGLAVFANAKDTYVCIPVLAKTRQSVRVAVARIPSLEVRNLTEYTTANHFDIPHDRLAPDAWSLKSDEEAAVFTKVEAASIPLGKYVGGRMFYGIKTGLNDAFVIDASTHDELVAENPEAKGIIHPFLQGRDIRRYEIEPTNTHLIYTHHGIDMTPFPAVIKHLRNFRKKLENRATKQQWYELQQPQFLYSEHLERAKIVFPDICKGPRFVLDTAGHYLGNTAYALGSDDPYLLGILNSRLFWFAISNISIPFGVRAGRYRYRLIYQYMEKVPIRAFDPSNNHEKAQHDKMVSLAQRLLSLHTQATAAKTTHERTAIQRQIEAADQEIDRLVYEIYGLSNEEICIVEGACCSS